MTDQEYKKSINTVIYLCSCAVNGTKPEISPTINLDRLYTAAKKHMLAAMVGRVLQKNKISTPAFKAAVAFAQRKAVILNNDLKNITAALEANRIWYMPLKGAVLKDYYPSFAAREMCDYDILFDSKRAIDVKSIMESLGFQVKAFGEFKEDVYHKPPVSNIEMHRMLFGEKHDTKLVEYYKDVKSRLLKDENNGNSASLHMPGGILRTAASLLLSRDAMPTPRMKMHRRQGKKR